MVQSIACIFAEEITFYGLDVQNIVNTHIKNAGHLIETTGGKPKDIQREEVEPLTDKPYILLPSSRQCILLYQFPISENTTLLLKVYYLPLLDITRHFVSIKKFKAQISTQNLSFEEKSLKITVTDVFGTGVFQSEDYCFPFLIQRMSTGLNISKLGDKEYRITNSLLSSIFRTITKSGFIIDPYPNNWFIHGYSPFNEDCEYCVLEYIDLVFENSIGTIELAKQVINSLEPLSF